MPGFTHFDKSGRARMVDVSKKEVSCRFAQASGSIRLNPRTIELIKENKLTKGDCLNTAKVAGIMSAKRVGDLIPLCHPLGIDWVDIEFKIHKDSIDIISKVKTTSRTGVEMEALTAVSVAALTIYDMCKAVDKSMLISDIKLDKKIKSI
ncbi:MAG: cyclic pyranopterin monophosphate synthase MoaC [Candidatus Omnitrophica bacterium]|nr:cyclic pyranopterin monophosphate synthase MoaC [Candidatus Omnitrophota bacterium]